MRLRGDGRHRQSAELGTRDARPVTKAIASNPFAVLVPRHRVIKKRRLDLRLPLGLQAQARAAGTRTTSRVIQLV
jgi:hypothetical protein